MEGADPGEGEAWEAVFGRARRQRIADRIEALGGNLARNLSVKCRVAGAVQRTSAS